MNNEITKEEVQYTREHLGLTREQFAQLLNISSMSVARWETNGIRSISNSSAGKFVELRKILDAPRGSDTISELLKSLPIGAAIGAVSAIIPIIGPITTIGLLSPFVLKAVKRFLGDENNK